MSAPREVLSIIAASLAELRRASEILAAHDPECVDPIEADCRNQGHKRIAQALTALRRADCELGGWRAVEQPCAYGNDVLVDPTDTVLNVAFEQTDLETGAIEGAMVLQSVVDRDRFDVLLRDGRRVMVQREPDADHDGEGYVDRTTWHVLPGDGYSGDAKAVRP